MKSRFKEEFMEEKSSDLLTSNPFSRYVLSFRFLYIFLGGFFFFLISISTEWLPHELFEIRKARIELVLREIVEISSS